MARWSLRTKLVAVTALALLPVVAISGWRAFDDARQALDMGLVNTVVPLAELEATTLQWCREMLENSPTALRFLKLAMNADCDGQAGMMAFAGSATLLYYTTDEGREGKEAYLEKRKPDFSRFKRYP